MYKLLNKRLKSKELSNKVLHVHCQAKLIILQIKNAEYDHAKCNVRDKYVCKLVT